MSDSAISDRTAVAPRSSRVLWVALLILAATIGIAAYVTLTLDAKPAPVKLALLTWNEDPFWTPVIRGANDAASQWNVNLTVVQSKPDVESQNRHIRELLAQGYQGIAISPNNPKAQLDVLNEAAGKVALITFDVDAPESKRRMFVGIDNYGAGQLAAEEVRAALPEGGGVLISVGSVEMSNGRERRQGLIDSLLDRPFKRDHAFDAADAQLKGTKYQIVGTVLDGGDPAKATAGVAEALRAHPEAKCVVGLFSYSAPAALAALPQANAGGPMQVIGFDETDATQAAIEAGTIRASILQDQYRYGNEVVRLLADEVRGLNQDGPEGARTITVQTNVLRKENIEELREMRQIRSTAASGLAQPTTAPALPGR